MVAKKLTFARLVEVISETHAVLAHHASKAINISLTTRNWWSC